jgi:uncharacterized protein (TIGR02145 family)
VLVGSAVAQQTGTFTDGRDGQKYKTVKIGTQTWMAENLNYQTESGSWCYENSADSCNKYGRLYDWMTAKTVCPKGWKLPSRKDWGSLGQAVGGKRTPDEDGNINWHGAGTKLKSKSGWKKNGNGTDDYGFSALPGGNRLFRGNFAGVSDYGVWWTATENGRDAYYRGMGYYYDSVDEGDDGKSFGFSVRCVQE